MRRAHRNTLNTLSLIGTAAVATVAAAATAGWTFLNGGTLVASSHTNLRFETVDSGAHLDCGYSRAKSTAMSGSELSGIDMVSIEEIEFSSPSNPDGSGLCSASAGYTGRVIPKGLPWKFQAGGFDAATGTVTGKVTGVSVSVEFSDYCQVDFTAPGGGPGEVYIRYKNSTGEILIDRSDGRGTNLVIEKTNGLCDPIAVRVGDRVMMSGGYEVEGVEKPVVTSP
ncbi:MAG: hypothetical protein ACRDNL_06390 [Spirillospora sp.]